MPPIRTAFLFDSTFGIVGSNVGQAGPFVDFINFVRYG